MEKFVLKAKPWQIFISLLIPTMVYTAIPGESHLLAQIKAIFIVLAFYSWLFLLGRGLNYCIPRRYMLSETFQTFNFFFVAIGFTVVTILLEPGEVIFTGFWSLLFLYFIFSYFYLFYFAAKALTSAERGKRTSFGDHIGEMILLLFGVFGVWVIQPRVNKVYEAHKEEFEDGETDEQIASNDG